MTFSEDIHQTKVKNSSFGNPKFSMSLHSVYLTLCCLNGACKAPKSDRDLLLKILTFYVEGLAEKFNALKKNSLKNGISSGNCFDNDVLGYFVITI
jgi:hypothetical protein